MVSAIWSMPPYEASKMPINFFLKFFQNHGLFKLKNRPQWYTVTNRSRTYVSKIISQISGEHYKNYKVTKIKRKSTGDDEVDRMLVNYKPVYSSKVTALETVNQTPLAAVNQTPSENLYAQTPPSFLRQLGDSPVPRPRPHTYAEVTEGKKKKKRKGSTKGSTNKRKKGNKASRKGKRK